VLVGLKMIIILLHAEDALQKLQEKHPPASGRLDDLPDINPESALSVTEIEVRQAVLSFPAGSSGGPDGMRPQHLKDMMLCRESGTDFLAALTAFTNVVLAGLCPGSNTIFLWWAFVGHEQKVRWHRTHCCRRDSATLGFKCGNTRGAARMAPCLALDSSE